eukprot:TRINITY_DN11414_c0_g1_i7.p2 TRINITY_DN11414_c0_g1~~TRINITY_DN11414_c0_g1_i7.p2  ORF type:complete len:160 (-),score=50.33 TRINITY_DN11414_c0_g1_i7:307-786(-)
MGDDNLRGLWRAIEQMKEQQLKIKTNVDRKREEVADLEIRLLEKQARANAFKEELREKEDVKREYDRMIAESEAAYRTFMQTSQKLLQNLSTQSNLLKDEPDEEKSKSKKSKGKKDKEKAKEKGKAKESSKSKSKKKKKEDTEEEDEEEERGEEEEDDQ